VLLEQTNWRCIKRANCWYCQERKLGQRLNIIVMSEGAVDLDGNLITAEYVREVRSASADVIQYTVSYDGTYYVKALSYVPVLTSSYQRIPRVPLYSL